MKGVFVDKNDFKYFIVVAALVGLLDNNLGNPTFYWIKSFYQKSFHPFLSGSLLFLVQGWWELALLKSPWIRAYRPYLRTLHCPRWVEDSSRCSKGEPALCLCWESRMCFDFRHHSFLFPEHDLYWILHS